MQPRAIATSNTNNNRNSRTCQRYVLLGIQNCGDCQIEINAACDLQNKLNQSGLCYEKCRKQIRRGSFFDVEWPKPYLSKKQIMHTSWWAVSLKGLILLALGIWVAKTGADISSTGITVFGFAILCSGLISGAVLLRRRKGFKWIFPFVESFIDVCIGLVLLFYPALGLPLFGSILGIWALIGGVVQVINSIRLLNGGFKQWWLLLLLGLTALGMGYVLVTQRMEPGATLTILLAVLLIIFGVLNILVAFSLRKRLVSVPVPGEKPEIRTHSTDSE